ncbi:MULTISPECIES: ShlB/FhaC/HecB family hemolysin secretion/activation protein [unclassified Polaromonas]|uniref:ShlB/FhaC/HecB family hemolysin secretion/activation protein n=1 Tax=unclassified Polaromonas TaxID=2638319 RepID=UPI001E286DEC|nr:MULTISPECIES: ShlB/FhaC/HecB family hemolysin secretion/activation protein [unclassified Polaromonas]
MNKTLLSLAMLALSQGLLAQQLPGAGSQIQQLPPVPVPQKAAPEIRIQEGATPGKAAPGTAKILVKSLQVTGSRVFSEAELLALTGFVPNTEMTLAELQAMAARITDHYRKNGYFVARAYLPAQSVTDNAVTIAVSEGQYGKIVLNNQTHLSDDLVRNTLSGVNSGDPITNDTLENRLLLLSDIPGVHVKSTLVPGETPGSSDLLVDITPGQRISGSVDVDNAGNRYTGEYRLGATVNINNLLGQGDVASFRAVTSGQGLNYGRASYQLQLGKATVGVAYSRLHYALGKEFAPLQANGTAEIASVYASYPLIRSRNTSLNAGLNYDHRTFQDRVDVIPSVVDKKANVVTASLYGSHFDNLGGGGSSAFSLGLSVGNLDIETPAALAADAASARTNGSYGKLAFGASRLQRVTDTLSFYAGVNGQLASKNLDSSEKMVLGGMDGVRAYPQGEAFGDQGYIITLEARLLLPKPQSLPGQFHLIGFVDEGSATINKKPWAAGDNHRNLGAYGVGLTWAEPGNFAIRTYYARKLRDTAATSAPDKSGRFWIQAVKYF